MATSKKSDGHQGRRLLIADKAQQQCTTLSHPSVRLRGTENDFKPQTCADRNCPGASADRHSPHLHCPFCVPTDVYQDAAILRAHYRVKHVDKGIDFAGLRILRCCSRCDITGFVKSEKKFRGPHWHCYRCKNGFNRRDEAMKHYKTHFRKPLTTFQIHIAQEVNGCLAVGKQQHQQQQLVMGDCSGDPHVPWIVDRSPVISVDSPASHANDNLTLSNDAVLFVQREDENEAFVDDPMADQIEVATSTPSSVDTHCASVEDGDGDEWQDADSCDCGRRLQKLKKQVKELQFRNKLLEEEHKKETQQLKTQVDIHSKEIQRLVKREQDLLQCLLGDYTDRSQQVIRQWALTQQHESDDGVAVTDSSTLTFPSDVFRLVLDNGPGGGGGTLMTPTKLLLQSDKAENEIECASSVGDLAEVVVSADVSLANETEYVDDVVHIPLRISEI